MTNDKTKAEEQVVRDNQHPIVLFSDSFSFPAKSKLDFLQGRGCRVVELVLEDRDGKTVIINRWGRCTWSDPFCAGCKYDGASSWRCLFRTITFGGCKVCKQNPVASGANHTGGPYMIQPETIEASKQPCEAKAVVRSQHAVVGLFPIALIPIPPAIFAANAKAVEEGHLTIGHGIVTALFLLAVLAATTIAILIVRWSLNRANKANPSRQGIPNGTESEV